MKLLLEANPKDATSLDKARCCAQTRPGPHYSVLKRPTARLLTFMPPTCRRRFSPFFVCGVSPFFSQSSRHIKSMNCAMHAPRTQEGKLPLHHAAAKGAPFDVVKLLLGANRQAAAVVAQARRRAHVPTPALPRCRCRSNGSVCFLSPSPLSMPRRARRFAGREAAPALRCRQGCHF